MRLARLMIALAAAVVVPALAVAQKPFAVQQQRGVQKYFGTDAAQLSPAEWQANWIWRPGEAFAKNVMLCARKTFTLAEKPATSKLYITADSHYNLWVNGEFVNRGPARSAPHHQSFDVLDISSKLKPGKNVLAIRVHHSGNAVSYVDKVRPGLLFQLEVPAAGANAIITSDRSVKVRGEAAWDTLTPQLDGSNMARVEDFDFNRSALGWEQPGFDDTQWENAALVQNRDWWPPRRGDARDFARMPPWLDLVPRDIPYLDEIVRPVKAVFAIGECADFPTARGGAVDGVPLLQVVQHVFTPLKYCKVENLEGFVNGKAELVIHNTFPKSIYANEPFRSTWIVFDMGELVQGHPRIEATGDRGTIIDVTYAAFLVDGEFNPSVIPTNQGDRVALPGRKVTWESQDPRTFRYIGLLVSGARRPVTISFAGLTETRYPFAEPPAVNFGDAFLDKLYRASDRTMNIITSDSYNDNYRERRQYIQTGFYAARAGYNLYGDAYLMRRQLFQIAQDQFANGFLPMHAPGKPKQGILDADLMWHMSLYDYYLFTGDRETLLDLLPNLERNLQAWGGLTDRDGLVGDPPHPYWIDHTDLDLRGINFTLNAWYLIALENDARLFAYLGRSAQAVDCRDRALKIRSQLRTRFWNDEKRLFAGNLVGGKQNGHYDEITNGVALLTGIADAEQAKSIVDKIMSDDESQDMTRPTIMMSWPVSGMFSAGYGKEAIALLKSRYATMMQGDAPTLWEGWSLFSFNQGRGLVSKIRSATQAEQVYFPAVFNRYILGVQATEPGMRAVTIRFSDLGLGDRSGAVPTPQGKISVAWSVTGRAKSLEVSYPKAVRVEVDRKTLPRGMSVALKPY